jgi:hypothetical protein
MTWGLGVASFKKLVFATRLGTTSPHHSTAPLNQLEGTSSALQLKVHYSRKDGLRTARKASQPEAIQIFGRGPLVTIAIRVEAILHQLRDKMLPHVDGTESYYPLRLQFCYNKRTDAVVVYANA